MQMSDLWLIQFSSTAIRDDILIGKMQKIFAFKGTLPIAAAFFN